MNLLVHLSEMPSNYLKNTRAPKPISTRTTCQRRTKSLLRKRRTGPGEVSKIKTTTNRTVHSNKEIPNTTYEIRQTANPDNIKTTQRNHLIEEIPKEERLPPPISNYSVLSRDSDFSNIWSTHKLNNTTLVR